ncbi:AsmA-like C-terminal region-containing protein [Chondrinema litorale]|uniref:AsmA-like C-terminal region-containing protein n=1 Tax=Chondrinema litorale TaxID=2994555 RepID=UPI0025435327|nr:AsmA-like C-terminal region-containing protein [Chondrinema litorale]UZR97127.1 hypothetical protein OQ292_23810 [Chondrinema litorale]
MKIKKVIKILAIILFVMVAMVSLVIGLTLNVVFTPEKITPLAEEILNNQFNAEVKCEGVELTFFSTFPRFGAKLNGTYIKSLNSGTEKDTLAAFNSAVISFNVYQYLKYHNISIQNITIKQPKLYAFVGKGGKTNWDIVSRTDSVETDTSSLVINDIEINHLEIENADLAYEDETTNLTYRAKSFSLLVQAIKSDNNIKFDVNTKSKNVEVYFKSNPVYQINNLGADLSFDYDSIRGNILVESKDITVNDIHFETKGVLTPKPEDRMVDVQLNAKLTSNSIDHFLSLIPPHFLPKTDIKTTGRLIFNVDVNGIYGNGNLPTVDFLFTLENGSLAYKNFPGKINTLTTKMEGKIYPNNTKPSFVNIENLQVKGTGIDIQAHGNAKDILNVAQVKAQLKGDVDLTELYQKFPVDSTVVLQGQTKVDFSTELSVDQILEEKYDQLNVAGIIDLNNVVVKSKLDTIEFASKAMNINFFRELKIYNKTFAEVKLDSTELHLKNNIYFQAGNIHLTGAISKSKSKESVFNLTASLKDINAGMQSDSVLVLLKRANLSGVYHPKDMGANAYITSDFTIDSIGISQAKNFVGIQQGSYQIRLDHKGPKIWLPKGNIRFQSLIGMLPQLGKPIFVPATKLYFENDNFSLDHTKLKYEDTDITLTGKIEHAIGFFTGKKVLAELELESDYINANQLMMVFAGMNETEGADNTNKDDDNLNDSTYSETYTFRIPDSIHFDFNTKIKQLKLGYSDFNDLKGSLKVENGNLYLNGFKLKTLAADLDADLVYSAKTKEKADLDFTFYLSQIEMDKLNEFLPILDSLFPMTKSFMGKVDYRMKGKATLNQDFDIDISSFKGIGAMKAENIMVMDGPTFTDLAKTFMFKNKELNPIQYLEAEMEFDGNDVNILPALLEIDRYKLAIGGIQHLDMTFDYHISVLESPVPFKTGVDVSGDIDDYNIKVTKAKYKYYFAEKERLLNKADTSVIKKKEYILNELGF